MKEHGRIKVGVDYDGVVIKKAPMWDLLRRSTKLGLPTSPGAIEQLSFLSQQPDVDVLGVYTIRPEWLRQEQTRSQIEQRGIPLDKVTHTGLSMKKKIEYLLLADHGRH